MTSFRGYFTGFILSLILTLGAYVLVAGHANSLSSNPPDFLIPVVIALALIQLVVQMVFFLHVTKESKPRWNAFALGFAVMVVVIVVFGSLWIMQNLSYHHPDAREIDSAIMHDEGIE